MVSLSPARRPGIRFLHTLYCFRRLNRSGGSFKSDVGSFRGGKNGEVGAPRGVPGCRLGQGVFDNIGDLMAFRCRGSPTIGDTMSPLADSQTSLTLMEMLREDPRNAVAWDRFVRRYYPKIYGWCRAWGLQEADADDVAQDVLMKLTEKMTSFRYDQSRCFRAW